jgi:hypothetical protein
MLSGVAGVAGPAVAAGRAGIPAATAIIEGLLGGSPTTQAAGDMARQFGVDESGALIIPRAPFDMGGGMPAADVVAPLNAPQPYEMSGADILRRLEGVPSAAEVAGKETGAIGSGFTGILARGRSLLPEHYSSGYMTGETVPPEAANWADLENKTIFGLVGDPTARKVLSRFGDTELRAPTKSEAGAEFADIPGYGWASARSAMASKMNAASKAEDPYFTFLNMSEQSGDFAVHTGKTIGEAFRVAPIASSNVPKIDEAIRKIGMAVTEEVQMPDGTIKKVSRTIRPFENFQSVADPNYVGEYIASLPSGTQRAAFVKGLDRANLQKMGVPDIGDIRLALANPDLVGRDWLSAGYRGFTPDVATGLLPTPSQAHSTYDTMIRKIGGAQTFDQGGGGVPANLLFRDLAEAMRAKGTGGRLVPTSADYKVYESSPYKGQQFMDSQAVELVSTFSEIENRFGRRAALQYANDLLSGGRITDAMIQAARKANAPAWMIAAMAPAGGLLSMQPDEEQY